MTFFEQYDVVSSLLADKKCHKVHALGALGIGVSGLLVQFKSKGWVASGCDNCENTQLRKWLEEGDITIEIGHSTTHISSDTDLVIRTTAVRDDAPELAKARELGVPIVSRGIALAAIVSDTTSIAVCGTHGKTTTSSFTAELLKRYGVSWCIGGYTKSLGGVAELSNSNAPLVVEADESDGTLALYSPSITIITNIEHDHLEHFKDFDDLKKCFQSVASRTRKAVICEASLCDEIRPHLQEGVKLVPFGASDFICKELSANECKISYLGEEITLHLPGLHNTLNAIAAFLAVRELGYEVTPKVIESLHELPHRRFERFEFDDGRIVISDYSHHPTEIKALVSIATLQEKGKIVAVFEPHRYTRTVAMKHDFPAAFRGIDEVIIMPIYAASEDPIQGGRSEDLYEEFLLSREKDSAIPVPILAYDYFSTAEYLRRSGANLVLVVGAGSVVKIVDMLCKNERRECQRLRVSYGTGGVAYNFFAPKTEEELAQITTNGTVRAIGQGTNLIINDAGVAGKIVSLTNFDKIVRDGNYLSVGAGVSGAKLLNFLVTERLSGLEFMAGIPGTVGGWTAMNAGVKAGEFGDRICSVRIADTKGNIRDISRNEAGFSYRHSEIKDRGDIVISVRLCFEKTAPEQEIRKTMEDFLKKRFNFAGLRTAGSVFKNPQGDSAGRILESLGCKGIFVGGATVSEHHANIVVAKDGAKASDVIALIFKMQSIAKAAGFTLEREVEIW